MNECVRLIDLEATNQSMNEDWKWKEQPIATETSDFTVSSEYLNAYKPNAGVYEKEIDTTATEAKENEMLFSLFNEGAFPAATDDEKNKIEAAHREKTMAEYLAEDRFGQLEVCSNIVKENFACDNFFWQHTPGSKEDLGTWRKLARIQNHGARNIVNNENGMNVDPVESEDDGPLRQQLFGEHDSVEDQPQTEEDMEVESEFQNLSGRSGHLAGGDAEGLSQHTTPQCCKVSGRVRSFASRETPSDKMRMLPSRRRPEVISVNLC